MADYYISSISHRNDRQMVQVNNLLTHEGIRLDKNVDYTCGLWSADGELVATGSAFHNTLRCLAVSSDHQGEGLMNQIITHLTEYQFEQGHTHLFLYTKDESRQFFSGLGFHPIVRIPNEIVFMENRVQGFARYLSQLERDGQETNPNDPSLKQGAIIMNANPFTKGHRYLVEEAKKQVDLLHLFIVSEEASLVPFAVRQRLVKEGTRDIPGIIYHQTGDYLISQATFPSYFQANEAAVIDSHTHLDAAIFVQIAKRLHITHRFLGNEPISQVTALYNQALKEDLPQQGVEVTILKRLEQDGHIISASEVRKAIHDRQFDRLQAFVPETTYVYFQSEEAQPIINRIQSTTHLEH